MTLSCQLCQKRERDWDPRRQCIARTQISTKWIGEGWVCNVSLLETVNSTQYIWHFFYIAALAFLIWKKKQTQKKGYFCQRFKYFPRRDAKARYENCDISKSFSRVPAINKMVYSWVYYPAFRTGSSNGLVIPFFPFSRLLHFFSSSLALDLRFSLG